MKNYIYYKFYVETGEGDEFRVVKRDVRRATEEVIFKGSWLSCRRVQEELTGVEQEKVPWRLVAELEEENARLLKRIQELEEQSKKE
jgi:hypothetical protein